MMQKRVNLPPLPDLAGEEPTLKLTHVLGVWTVAAMVNTLRDGIARVTDGDLARLIALGELAYQERKARGGD